MKRTYTIVSRYDRKIATVRAETHGSAIVINKRQNEAARRRAGVIKGDYWAFGREAAGTLRYENVVVV